MKRPRSDVVASRFFGTKRRRPQGLDKITCDLWLADPTHRADEFHAFSLRVEGALRRAMNKPRKRRRK